MIEKLCRKYTSLTESDIKQIENIASMIPYFCELSNVDIFIDCFMDNCKKGVVVFHGKALNDSLYENNIQGEVVLPENEPIVFYTKKTGKVIRDAKGFSQENKWVLQRTVPIYNNEKKIIGVLVEERNVTDNMKMIHKLEKMEKQPCYTYDEFSKLQDSENINKAIMVQEMHHRIKNNLQIISSILSMQERRSVAEETKRVLKDNISRINSIAQVHEKMTSIHEDRMNINEQIRILVCNMMNYASSEEKEIEINLSGEDLYIDSEKALAILMIINELITNSIRHGYKKNEKGNIDVTLIKGTMFSTIIVQDDGSGYISGYKENKRGLGNEIVKMMVYDKLKGSLFTSTNSAGTCVNFDFKMNSDF